MKTKYLTIIIILIVHLSAKGQKGESFEQSLKDAKQYLSDGDDARYFRETRKALEIGIDLSVAVKNSVPFDKLMIEIGEFLSSAELDTLNPEFKEQALGVRMAILSKAVRAKISHEAITPVVFIQVRKNLAISCLRFAASIFNATKPSAIELADAEVRVAKAALADLPLEERREMFEDFGPNSSYVHFKSEPLKAAIRRTRLARNNRAYAETLQNEAKKIWPKLAIMTGTWLAHFYSEAPLDYEELDTLLRSHGLDSGPLSDAVHKK